MSGENLYFTDMLDVLVAAGCVVGESATTNGWERRARSSGGFPLMPLGLVWHHTASNTTPANDLAYMINNCPDAPVGNCLVDRDGVWWPIAAGASNCAGKSETAKTFSRGTCPVSSGNTHLFNVEFAADGVGSPWPQVQIDSGFRGFNALNARFGNTPMDVITHALGAGDGYTNRKVDPATATAVEGPWVPRWTNSSGTWSLADIRNECALRAGQGDDDMPLTDDDVNRIAWAVWSIVLGDQSTGNHIQTAAAAYGAATDAPGRTVNYPLPYGDATADLWTLIVDTHHRVVELGDPER